jgi:nitrous-oxide reductase
MSMSNQTNKRTGLIFAGLVSLALTGIGVGWTISGCGGGGEVVAASVATSAYNRPHPMPHGYYKETDEFYVFASGGQQGGFYVYGVPSMKLISEIPIFNVDPAWGWTPASKKVREQMTNPYTGELVRTGDTHHPNLSRKNGIYDGKWIFINDKRAARVARVNLDDFRCAEVLWVPNVNGGMHGFHTSANTDLLVGNIELEAWPAKVIRDHIDVPMDREKGPYAGCVFGIDVADDGKMKNAWQVWGPWQFDMVRVGMGKMDGWIVNTAYNTERAVNVVGMFKRPEDYVFFWNIASIKKAIADKKFVTTKEAPDVPCISWRDVEVYAVPCPLNPHGVDCDPTGQFAVVNGKATTLLRHVDFLQVQDLIAKKQFMGEEFGVPILDAKLCSGDIDAGLGPTHIDFDDKGYMYAGFFVDSDVKKITVGGDAAKAKHGQEPWKVVDTMPAHYSVGHLCVPGGDSAKPYGKYLLVMNKLAKDTFIPHGPLVTESHELFDITKTPCPLVDQMPLPPETHYSQACPVDLIKKNAKKVYELPANIPVPGASYDYAKKEVNVTMSAVRSFFTPDWFTVPQGWKVNLTLINVEQILDMSHGWSLCGYDVMESIDPGEVKEISYTATKEGVFWYYCLWFCSELHVEMRGRMIVIPQSEWNKDKEWKPIGG